MVRVISHFLFLCILLLVAIGSIHPPFDHSMSVNHHNSYLGAIEYNEYGMVNKEVQPYKVLAGFWCIASCFIVLNRTRRLNIHPPKRFLYPFVRLRKLLDLLLPLRYQSRLFVFVALFVF